MVANPPSFRSLHGREFGLTPRGLEVYGRPVVAGSDIDLGGNTYYVNSGHANASNNNDGLSTARPLATLDGAIGKCTANHGDRIIVMPNHAETITGAGGITADVAGISIIGLGVYNQRPRFLMDAGTTVTFVVNTADVYVENLVFAAGHADIVTCFDVDAVGFTAVGLEFVDNTANENFVAAFTVGSTTDNTCDGLTIVGCRAISPDTAFVKFIDLTGDTDFATIKENVVILDAAAAQFLVHASGDDVQGLDFGYNLFVTGASTGDLLIDNDQTDNTGIVYNNYVGGHDVSAAILVDADGVRLFENYSADSDTASGVLTPAADTLT